MGLFSTWVVWLGAGFIVVVLLLFVYLQGNFRHRPRYHITHVPPLQDSAFCLAMTGLTSSFVVQGQPIDFLFDVDQIYKTRLALIRQAQQTIHFETFYMLPGRRANEFADALIERALAGVQIRLIVDSFGVFKLSQRYWKRLQAAGVDVRFFHPFSWRDFLHYNQRTHRKIFTVDGKVGWLGGIGIADVWDGNPKTGDMAPWLDTEMGFRGPIVSSLESIFMQHWLYLGGEVDLGKTWVQAATETTDAPKVLITPSMPTEENSALGTLFYATILAAQDRIWLASPYFFLEPNSRQVLLQAQKRGVDVRVLTVGPRNDKKLVYYAVRELYDDLLQAGIQIYEHQPSMMHAKVILIDDHWVSTGSANLDPRSLFHNDELHLSLSDPSLAQQVEYFFEAGFTQSQQVRLETWRSRPIWQQVLGRITLFLRWQL